MKGQISLFDYMPVRIPCGRPCQYEWGSLRCFEMRGNVYDYVNRQWVRNEDGSHVIGKKECDWEPGEQNGNKGSKENY